MPKIAVIIASALVLSACAGTPQTAASKDVAKTSEEASGTESKRRCRMVTGTAGSRLGNRVCTNE